MQTDSEGLELIIILALVAGFILFQLRRTLGKKTGYDPSKDDKKDSFGKPRRQSRPLEMEEDEDNVIALHQEMHKPATPVNLGLSKNAPYYGVIEQINRFDPTFTLQYFFDGAEYAYGLILNAFWDKDRKTLRSMLSREVYDQFDSAVAAVEEKNLHHENKLLDIEKISLVEASLDGSMAEVTVEFNSHMTLSSVDADGKVVEGDPGKAVPIRDIWTFCRDVKSADPNWTLVATRNS